MRKLMRMLLIVLVTIGSIPFGSIIAHSQTPNDYEKQNIEEMNHNLSVNIEANEQPNHDLSIENETNEQTPVSEVSPIETAEFKEHVDSLNDTSTFASQPTLKIENLRAPNSNLSTVETVIKFEGNVNKSDVVTLTYTAEDPYNQRIFDEFVNGVSFNDTRGVFDYQVNVVGNTLTITLTPLADNLDSPYMSIIFPRETLHEDIKEEDCEFVINNDYTFWGETFDVDPILVNSIYYDFHKAKVLESQISGPNYWYADKVSIGFEDLINSLVTNTIVSDQPFMYRRNTSQGVFIPNSTIYYDNIPSSMSPGKIKFKFTPKGPGTIDWDNVTMYRVNQTTGEETIEKITLSKQGNSYYYEVDLDEDATGVDSFSFGMKVSGLEYDPDRITDLTYDTELCDNLGGTIYSTSHINGIHYVSPTGTGWTPTLDIREDFSVCFGETPDYTIGLKATDPQTGAPDLDITDRVVIDDSLVNYNLAGEYPVVYTVTDDDGNMISKTLVLTILSKVTINYVDEDGNILQSVTLPCDNVGETFSKDSPEIDGYIIVDNSQSVVSGDYEKSPQVINVVYKKDPSQTKKAKVITKYQDENGQELSEDNIQFGEVGDNYQTTSKTIPGYVLIAIPTNQSGVFTDEDIVVIYVYRPISVLPPNPPKPDKPKPDKPNKPTDPNDEDSSGYPSGPNNPNDDDTSTTYPSDPNKPNNDGSNGIIYHPGYPTYTGQTSTPGYYDDSTTGYLEQSNYLDSKKILPNTQSNNQSSKSLPKTGETHFLQASLLGLVIICLLYILKKFQIYL